MKSFLAKIFGGLNTAYYVRHLVFGSIFGVLCIASAFSQPDGQVIGTVIMAVLSTVLYPYARFVYESIMRFIMGDNIFAVNALWMMVVKIMTMATCWFLAVFIAPLGLGYLYWHNSRIEQQTPSNP